MWNQLIYGDRIFVDREVSDGSMAREQDLTSASLSADSLSATVRTSDPTITAFSKNAPLTYIHRGTQRGIYYLQSITRVSPTHYTLYGLTAMGLLSTQIHPGGIYTGQTVQEIVASICGPVPVIVNERMASIRLYGWLPYAKPPQRSARDNLAEVLFAIGASAGTDLDGVLRIEPLWDGVSSTVTSSRMYQGGSAEYGAPVSAVIVTEHQYIQGGEETELFSGTAQSGDIITFDNPMHDLTATGFAILESGANYAKLSAGTGILTGRAYIHSTRQVRQTVTEGAAENVKTITDATLVTLVNAVAVTNRLAEYYRCLQTIETPIVAQAEKPGYVVSIYHPYEKRYVDACISTMDDTISKTLRSDVVALVGFRPPQPEDAEYFDERVVLTGTGQFSFPEDAENGEAVLIGAGQGGKCGKKGQDGTSVTVSWTDTVLSIKINNSGYAYGAPSKGGDGGEPGQGGKVLQIRLDLTQGRTFSYQCGVGGLGAPYNADSPDAEGSLGTDTIFGSYTSADGDVLENGYTDPITGERFAEPGDTGIAGGDSAGLDETAEVGTPQWATPVAAGQVTDEDGNPWSGGASNVDDAGQLKSTGDSATFNGSSRDGDVQVYASGALGGGAAAGNPGTPGTGMGRYTLQRIPDTLECTEIIANTYGANGVNGADALLVPKKPAAYGKGGRGGYGGGAGSPPGYAFTGQGGTPIGTVSRKSTPGIPGVGGKPSEGGPAADGCIIVFYRRPVSKSGSGPLVTADPAWFLDSLGRWFIV